MYFIVTLRSFLWVVLSWVAPKLMVDAIFNRVWLQTATDSIGILNDYENYPYICYISLTSLIIGVVILGMTACISLLSCFVQSVLKKSIFTITGAIQCVAGIFFIFGLMLYPMAWGTNGVKQLCQLSAPFYSDNCSIGCGLYTAICSAIITFICACLSVVADNSTSSDLVQERIYKGDRMIFLL